MPGSFLPPREDHGLIQIHDKYHLVLIDNFPDIIRYPKNIFLNLFVLRVVDILGTRGGQICTWSLSDS